MLRKMMRGAFLVAGSAVFADNPIITHRYLADPNGFVYGDRLYAICSNDDQNRNGYDMMGSVLISTKDMMNWSDHGEVYHAPKDGSWGGTAYAPTAVVRDGKVYYYVPNAGSAIGVLVADRPEGPLKNPLGKALITGSLCDGVAWCFDPGAFVDDNGQAYLVYGGGSNGSSGFGQNIRIIKLNKDMISVSGSPIRLSLNNSFEGPFLSKYKGTYYIQYPMNPNSNIGLSMSSNPTSGWTHKGSILDNPSLDGRNINGGNNSHTSIMAYGDQWYMFYHDRRLSGGATHKRNVSIDKMSYKADGSIEKVIVTKGIAQVGTFNPYDSIPAVTYSKQNLISAYTNVGTANARRINLLVPRKPGAWMRVSGADFGTGAKEFKINAGGNASSAKVEIRVGSETGTLAGTCTLEKTGSWTSLKTSTCEVTGLSGVKDVYLKFTGTDSNAVADWWRFVPTSSEVRARALRATHVPTAYQVFDLEGRLVRRFETATAQPFAAAWEGVASSFAPGAYLLARRPPEGLETRRVVRLERP